MGFDTIEIDLVWLNFGFNNGLKIGFNIGFNIGVQYSVQYRFQYLSNIHLVLTAFLRGGFKKKINGIFH